MQYIVQYIDKSVYSQSNKSQNIHSKVTALNSEGIYMEVQVCMSRVYESMFVICYSMILYLSLTQEHTLECSKQHAQ